MYFQEKFLLLNTVGSVIININTGLRDEGMKSKFDLAKKNILLVSIDPYILPKK